MRILITGGTGFVGAHLLSALKSVDGVEVVATMRPGSLIPLNLDSGNIEWVMVDEGFKNKIYSFKKFDAILHLATCYGKSGESILDIEMANVSFPLLLLDFAVKGGCDAFVNTDSFFSRELYSYSYMKEYILSKQFFLKWGRLSIEKNPKLQFINARLEHVYGPMDKLEKFIPSLANDLASNKAEIKLTSCEQERDFIYVSDVVDAFLKILKCGLNSPGFKEFEVGTGTPTPLKEFVNMLKMHIGSNSRLLFNSLPQRSGEIMTSFANTESLRSLGWAPQIKLDEGIRSLYNCRK